MENELDNEEKEYIKENCIIVNTGKRKLWQEPKGEEIYKNKKIKIGDLRRAFGIETEFASEAEDNFELKPILINDEDTFIQRKRNLRQTTVIEGRLNKKIRRFIYLFIY